MQKFKQGDLIIKGGKMMFARLVGENETLFDEIEIYGFKDGTNSPTGYSTFGTTRSTIIPHVPESCKTGRCAPRQFNQKSGRIEPEQREGTFPILGHVSLQSISTGVMIDMSALVRYYPELAATYAQNIVRYANRKIAETQPEKIPNVPGAATAEAPPDFPMKAMIEQTLQGLGFRRVHETEHGGVHMIRPLVPDDMHKTKRPITESDLRNDESKPKGKAAPKRSSKKAAAKKPAKKTARKR